MMDKVLERLQTLQAELAAIDPSRELDAADRVAAMASALRAVLVQVDEAVGRKVIPELRRVG